jgi:ankyrin repeat protein
MSMKRDPLIKAAKYRDLAALNNAIQSGVDLNSADSQGWTALFHAAHRGWREGMRTIIQAGADVNHGSEYGFTALFSAVGSGCLESVQLLVDAGAQVYDVQGGRLTGYAQAKRRAQIIAVLEQATRGNSN